MSATPESLAAGLHANAEQWAKDGSPFYCTLAHRLAADVAEGGPCWPVLQAHAEHPLEEVPGARLLAGVHRLVLEGRAPALAAHYPSVGGDGDAEAAWPVFRGTVETNADELAGWVDHVPQTNEVARSMALVGGWLAAAELFGLPARLLEPGCSAGLNLRADRYWYEQGGDGWGDASSTVRFVDKWRGGTPAFDAPLEIVDRQGCDRFPLDAASEDDRLTLLAYVFADEFERFSVLREALDIAASVPVPIYRGDAIEWLEEQLAELPSGTTTIVYHSYFWQYLPENEAARGRAVMEAAGMRATADAPLAWVSLEAPHSDYAGSELRLRAWPPDEEHLLGHCLVHPQHVDWIDQTT